MPKILAIDDNNDNLISLKAIVNDTFPESTFYAALNGPLGIELAIVNDPDVILLDVIMPDMDGFEVCRQLKQITEVCDIPVVFVTALKGDRENRIKALEVGAEGFLSKPIDETELTAQIRAMVKIKTAIQQSRDEKTRLKRLVGERTHKLEMSQIAALNLVDELKAENEARRKTELALRESEDRFHNLFEKAPLGYQSLDENGCFIEVNAAWLTTLGFEREDVMGKWFGDFLAPEFVEPFRKRFPIFKAQGHIHSEFVMIHRNGERKFIGFEGRIGYQTDGSFEKTHCILQDITERKKSENALLEASQFNKEIIESAQEGVIVYDLDLRYQVWNPFMESITGVLAKDVLGKHPLEVFPFLKEVGVIDRLQMALQGETPLPIDFAYNISNGNKGWTTDTSSPLRNNEGKIIGVIGTVSDITERKLAEEKLSESEAQFREFFEKAADAIFVAEFESGIIVDANEAASHLLLMPREQIVGMHQSRLHPEIKEGFPSDTFQFHKNEAAQKRSSSYAINQVVRPDGILVDVEILASEVVLKGKQCMMGTFRDITERKKAEQALKENEEKYRLVVDLLPDAIIIHSEGKVVFANHATFKILGATSDDQLIGQSVIGFVHPEYRDRAIDRIKKIFETGEPSGYAEEKFINFNNEIIIAEVIGIPITYSGKPAIQTILRNITDRKKAEEALKFSEENLKILRDSSTDIICSYDLEGRFASANKAFYITTGFPENFVLGKTHQEAGYPEENCREWDGYHRQVIETKNSVSAQSTTYMSDGLLHHFDIELYPLNDAFSNLTGIGVTIRDITDRKRAEEKIKENFELFQVLFNSSPDAIVLIDPHNPDISWPIVDCNRAACLMNGFEKEELIGRSIDILHEKITNKEERQEYLEFLRQVKSVHKEAYHKHKDGHLFPIEIVTTLVNIGGREFVLGIDRDITERKKAEAELNLQKQRLADVIEGTNAGTWTWNIQTGEVILNERWAEIIGCTLEELKPIDINTWISHVHPEDLPLANEMLGKHFNKEVEYFDVEFRQPHKNGKWIWVNSRGKVIEWTEDSKPLWISGTHLDITERKEIEIELQQSQTTLRGVIDSFPGEIFWKDLKSVYLGCNKAFAISSKLASTDAIIGKNDFELPWADSGAESYVSMDRQVMETGNGLHGLISSHVQADGKTVWLDTSKIPLVDPDGKVIGILGVSNDITDIKIVESELRQSQSMLSGVVDSFPGIVFWKDLNSVYQGCNKTFSDGVGLANTQDMVGKNDFDLPWEKSEAEQYRQDDQRVMSNAKAEIGIIETQLRADGGIVWLDTSKIPLVDSEGEVVGILGVSHDITDIKKAQESLQASSDLNNSLLHTIPFGMDIVDEYGNVLFQNDKLENLFGVNAIGMKCWELYRDDKTQCGDCPLYAGTQLGKTELYETQNALGGRTFQISHTGMMFQGKKAMLEIFQDVTEKKKAEIELEEINQRFSNLVETTDGIVWEADAETFVFSFVSKNAERLLGYDEQEWYQPNFWRDHIFEEDREKIVAFCVAQTGFINDHDFEYRFNTKDGRVIWLADFVKVIVVDGKPSKLNGLMVDITERKKIELALSESEDRYRQFVSQVSEGVYRFESDQPIDIALPVEEQIDLIYDHMVIAECNDAFLEMYKFKDRDEILGKGHLDFHGGRNNPVNRESLRTFVKNGYRIEDAITEEANADGHSLIISNNSVGIIENNQLVRMWGTQLDITQKVRDGQVQQVLYEISNAALSAADLPELVEIISREIEKLLDSTNFFIAFYDEKTNMLSTVYERDEKDILQSWSAEKSITGYVIKHRKSIMIREEDMKRLSESGEFEIYGTLSKIWLGVPLIVNKKAIGAIVVQSYDNPDAYTEKDKQVLEFISNQVSIAVERKKSELEIKDALTKAQESDRLKSAFLANMSHEIRTPLNSIIGFSELLADSDFDHEQQFEFAEMINASGTNLLAILTDIMDISKIEAGQVEVKKAKFSIIRLMTDIQREYSYKAIKKGIQVTLSLEEPGQELFIYSDETKLRQVFVNLVGNAMKFTSEGTVEIGLRKIGQQIRIQVKDTGIGIPEEFHEEIFKRFRQVESANTRKYGGNGLGLAISKSLVEILGGEIGMESVVGEGSTFYFTIPILDK